MLLAVAAHVLGGAMQPSLAAVVVAVVVVFAGARAGAARERSFGSLAAAMLAVQTGLHVAFMLLPERAGAAGGSWLVGLPLQRLLCFSASHTAVMRTAMAGQGAGASMHLTSPGGPTGALMLAGHVAAGLALTWGLRRGEAAVWSLATLPRRVALQVLRFLTGRPVTVLSPLAAHLVRRRSHRPARRLRGHLLRQVLDLRGPPLPA